MSPENSFVHSTQVNMGQEQIWNDKVEDVRKRVDTIGGEMDPGITDTVVAFNVHGIPTSGSCEGHTDHGLAAPWVDIEAENESAERYVNEKEIYRSIAAKYGLTDEQLRDGEHEKEWIEACEACEQSGESDAFRVWRQKNLELRTKVEQLLQEYTIERGDVESAFRLEIERIGGGGAFRIHNGGTDYSTLSDNRTDVDRMVLAQHIDRYRDEMRRFAEYLKKKFFMHDSYRS